MITNQVYDLADRVRSYELVAGLELSRTGVPA